MSLRFLSKLRERLAAPPELVGTVTQVYGDGTALVALVDGTGSLRVRNPQSYGMNARVFVQDGLITSDAPALPFIALEV
jgi:hypothetical protein